MYSDHSHHETIVCVTDSPSVKGSGTPRKVRTRHLPCSWSLSERLLLVSLNYRIPYAHMIIAPSRLTAMFCAEQQGTENVACTDCGHPVDQHGFLLLEQVHCPFLCAVMEV